ncbi:MAG: GCN5-related N-acetyltransferase [Candidatus Bathyarchaeota archaeon B63]|nr:MAG: GCN5-related N-acetyltransferase [Candidatus Bathyarchaeota archaeon B63]
MVAEVEGRVIASSSITKRRFSCENHVGDVGIIIKSGYRDLGIGTEIMKTLIDQARRMGLEILTLTVFATNKRAIHVYEKVGFREVGRIPKAIYRNGEYIDRIIMAKELLD